MFQTVEDIKKYTDIIQFICGMSNDTECTQSFLDLTCDKFTTQINKFSNPRFEADEMQSHLMSWYRFLVNLQREAFSETDLEVFSWTSQNSGVVLAHKRLTWCLSGLWGIENKSTGIAGVTDELFRLNALFQISNLLSSYCLAVGFDNEEDGLLDAEKEMSVIIQRHFKLSQNIDSFFGACHLPRVVSAHIFEELKKKCTEMEWLLLRKFKAFPFEITSQLTLLDFSDSEGIPSELGEALSKLRMTLEEFNVSRCRMTTDVSRSVLKGLSQCFKLKNLDLSKNILTDCFVHLFDANKGVGFSSLEDFDIYNCKLSRDDAEIVWRSLYSGKLPQLHSLRISLNSLTDSVRLLENNYSEQSTVLPLQELKMNSADLSSSDIAGLSEAVALGKLPDLQLITLSFNDFSSMGEDIKALVLSCKSECPQSNLQINLQNTELSQQVQEDIRFQCLGTVILWYTQQWLMFRGFI